MFSALSDTLTLYGSLYGKILDHFQIFIFPHIAYCKNSVDGQWYCFDDSEVQPMADEDVCQQTAYILFYQRRATIPSWSANSSVAGEPLHIDSSCRIKYRLYSQHTK